MLVSKRLHRDTDRLFTIADLSHESGREECQAAQPGHLPLDDAFKPCDFSERFHLATFDPVPPTMRLGDGLDEGRVLAAEGIAVFQQRQDEFQVLAPPCKLAGGGDDKD